MPKVFFDMFPAKGHYHATLKLASLLKQADHEVSYGVTPEFKDTVAKHGFGAEEYNPFFFVQFKARRVQDQGSFFITNLLNALSGEGIKQARAGLVAFKEHIQKIEPELVILDEQNVYKAIFYEALGYSVIVFQTKPDTRRIQGIPPFTSYFLPTSNVSRNVACSNWLWMVKILISRFHFYWQKTVFFNQNDLSIYEKLSRELNTNVHERIDWNRSFGKGIKGIPRLIISPKAFDFPHAEENNVFRVGPLIDIKREGKIQNPRYKSLIRKIEEYKGNGLIIYCSMGTVSGNDLKRVSLFFKKVIKVANRNRDDLFILSTGKFMDVNRLLPAPANVVVFEHVPQIDLLQYTDLMITHGGMNSINECVYCEVPVLIYPLSLKWDQPGNSARAVYHGLGLRGKIRRDSVKTISRKIDRIKQNHEMYKTNIRKMKMKFEEHNNSKQAVKIIESFIP